MFVTILVGYPFPQCINPAYSMYQTVPDCWIQPNWLARSSLAVAPDLLGCRLVRRLPDGHVLQGTIVETEAYTHGDPACHAYRRRTARNSVMFGSAGFAYVYLIYGMYHCLNVVTDQDGWASAVLLRSLQVDWVPANFVTKPNGTKLQPMLERLAAGPGKLCQLFQIDRQFTGQPFHPTTHLWLEPRSPHFQHQLNHGQIQFVQTTRIGLTRGIELPWRWYIADSPAVSKQG